MLDRRRFGYNNWTPLLILATGLAFFTGCDDSVEPVPEAEPTRTALVALYEATNGYAWSQQDNWLTDAPLGLWYGVEVDHSGRVIGLDLTRNGLNGSIPAELANLTELENLLLGNNRLSGAIPPQLGELGALATLDLRTNRLSGAIPPELGDLTRLGHLDLYQNRLTGPIPESLGRLSALTHLNLTWNKLTGPIPESLGRLSALSHLNLSLNDLMGPLPPQLGDLSNLAVLFLGYNDLTGPIPPRLGDLSNLAVLFLGYNDLTGPIPAELGRLANLIELTLEGNRLTGPIPAEFGNLDSLKSLNLTYNDLTGPIPAALGNLSGLDNLWLSGNRLTGPIPAALGNLTGLEALGLSDNRLSGPIPSELGNLANLKGLVLSDNDLTGPIPAALGGLDQLLSLGLEGNNLIGLIPGELGNLGSLRYLNLGNNNLTGPIPILLGRLGSLLTLDLRNNNLAGTISAIGGLGGLRWLRLQNNRLSGPIPAGFGGFRRMEHLQLSGNELTGAIPPQLGGLTVVDTLDLSDNGLTGPIPASLGQLDLIAVLDLSDNDLSGPLPEELGDLATLRRFDVRRNPGLSAEVPGRWTDLRLRTFLAGETGLCVPDEPEMMLWLESITTRRVRTCQGLAAYLVQAVQSRRFPVPLVAGEDALLRVFPTALRTTDVGLPAVRASFYLDGTVTHVVDIPGQSTRIPTTIDEGSLLKSANAEIPGELVQPGLEMVIEIDPEGTLDPDLGVARRIPETGRLLIRAEVMPPLDFMFLPFLWSEDPDSAILEVVQEMADGPTSHDLLAPTRALLPVAEVTAEAHEPVWTSSNEVGKLYQETEAIRIMEQGSALIWNVRYMGTMSGSVDGGTGQSRQGGRHGFVVPEASAIVRQVGHLFNLRSAPCSEEDPDPYYPHGNGAIGAWGYDPGAGELVSPATPDLMSNCGPVRWISDYHFTNAYSYRLVDENVRPSAAAATARSLLLWGGVDAGGTPYLEPALVVDAPPALPLSGGDHEVTGRTAEGEELFSLRFGMPVVDGGDGGSSFVFAIPVEVGWGDQLASITLSGPGGNATLNLDTDRPVVILRDPRSGQVRGILRGSSAATLADPDGRVSWLPLQGLEVWTSPGIPGLDAWRR